MDPKLPVNFVPEAPHRADEPLGGEGQTSPTGVTDLTFELSTVYNDPDTGDTADFYRLQVSTSSTD
jgi:hypothetical protein